MGFYSNLLSEFFGTQSRGLVYEMLEQLLGAIIQAPEADVKPNRVSVPGQVTLSCLGCSSFLTLFSHHSWKARHCGWAGPLSLPMPIASPYHCLKACPGAAGAQQPAHSRGLVSSITQMYAQALGTFTFVSALLLSLALVLCPAFSIIWPNSCIASSLKDAKRNFLEIIFKIAHLKGVMSWLLTPQQAAVSSAGALTECMQDGVASLGVHRIWWSPWWPREQHLSRWPTDQWKAQDSRTP